MKLRAMTASDLERVAMLERAATDYPWSSAQFDESLNATGYVCSVLEVPGQLCGFAVFQIVLDEATLMNIAVDPGCQGRGYGRELLESGLISLREKGVVQCFLEVRHSNHRAIALYHSLGFSEVGLRRNYYPAKNGREDALVMSRAVPQEELGDA